MAVWAAIAAAGMQAAGTGIDWYYKERQADETRASRKDQKEVAMRRLGLQEDEMKLLEKQRGFKRLMTLIGTGNTLTNQAAGANRLSALRSSGQRR